MKTNKSLSIKPMGVISSLFIYIPAALLLFFLTKYSIPYLSKVTGYETILFWFIVAGIGVFTPLIIAAVIILKSEGYKFDRILLRERLRFRGLNKTDLLLILIGFVLVSIFSLLIMKALTLVVGQFNHTPAFMAFEPLSSGRYWLLLIWFPYWLLNILGEELLWRGVMLPRQELFFGKYTWIFHGFGWGLFHIAFGWQLLITLIPLIFIQSYLVQRTKNTWVGVILHAGVNGSSFIAIALGLM